MRISSRSFILIFSLFIFLIIAINFLDDSFLILANFLFVLFNLFIFLREFLGEFIHDDIEKLYYKYVYYYEVNIEYLKVLRGIYSDRCSNLQDLFIELYISIYLFYYRRFFLMLAKSYLLNLRKIETFLFTFLENEILLRKYISLGILVSRFNALESNVLSNPNVNVKIKAKAPKRRRKATKAKATS